jgi:hypothetical protein
MINYKQELKKYLAIIGGIFLLLAFILSCMFIIPIVNAENINISPSIITTSSITWNWSHEGNITSLAVDGSIISNLDNTTSLIVVNNLQPYTPHVIKVKFDNNDTGENTTYTSSLDKSSAEKTQDFIWEYILLFVAIILCVVGIIVPVVGMIGFIFALMFLLQVYSIGNIYLDLMAFALMIACSCITYVGVKK